MTALRVQQQVSASSSNNDHVSASSTKSDHVSASSMKSDRLLASSTENSCVSSAVSSQVSASGALNQVSASGISAASSTQSSSISASSSQNNQPIASSTENGQVSASSTENSHVSASNQVSASTLDNDQVSASSTGRNQVSASSSANCQDTVQVSSMDNSSNLASSSENGQVSASSTETCQVSASSTENNQAAVSSMEVDQEGSLDGATSSGNNLGDNAVDCDASDSATTTYAGTGSERSNSQGISSSSEFRRPANKSPASNNDANSLEGSEATCTVKDASQVATSSQVISAKTETNQATSSSAVASSSSLEETKPCSVSEPTSSSTENVALVSNSTAEDNETSMEVCTQEAADSVSASVESNGKELENGDANLSETPTSNGLAPPTSVTTSEKSTPSKKDHYPAYEHVEYDEYEQPNHFSQTFPAENLFEYQWPDKSGEWYILQEQVSEYLGVKSFKRKYPDLKRRSAEMKEKEFLRERGVVTETQCDLGLSALRCEEVYDLMLRDYPEKYQEYSAVLHERERQIINEKHKGYEAPPKLEKSKMADYVKKAMKSASEFNSQFQKERREDRRAYFDLQTMVIHYPAHKYKKMDPEFSKVTAYPVSLIPGQYQEYYRKYKPNELKYFPLNTAIYGPPKRIVNPLVKVTSGESDDDVDDSQEDQADSGSDADSNDNDSSDSETSNPSVSQPSSNQSPRPRARKTPMEPKDSKESSENQKKECRFCHKGPGKGRAKKDELVSCSECGSTGGKPQGRRSKKEKQKWSKQKNVQEKGRKRSIAKKQH